MSAYSRWKKGELLYIRGKKDELLYTVEIKVNQYWLGKEAIQVKKFLLDLERFVRSKKGNFTAMVYQKQGRWIQ